MNKKEAYPGVVCALQWVALMLLSWVLMLVTQGVFLDDPSPVLVSSLIHEWVLLVVVFFVAKSAHAEGRAHGQDEAFALRVTAFEVGRCAGIEEMSAGVRRMIKTELAKKVSNEP